MKEARRVMADPTAELKPYDGRSIPQALKEHKRWAPWIALWNDKRQKYDKVPRRADVPEYGLSTADPSRWFTFAAALATFRRESPPLAGVGYVMTGAHGIVGVDLDDCIADGQLAPWAREVVDALRSYTEISPSGRGLRIFVQGEVTDWMNHTVGIEVYGGTAPRFLTITGEHLVGTPLDVLAAPAGALGTLHARYGPPPKTPVDVGDMPDLLDELVLPDVAALELPYQARDFLDGGEAGEDRSRTLHATGVALYQAGLADDEVLSVLAANPFAMEVALDHRGQDPDRALLYLWREHCGKAKGKAGSRIASAEDFDVVTSPATAAAPPAPKGMRFRVLPAAEFMQRSPAAWLVKGLLPQAGLAVVFGESGSGKTFFILDVVGAIARGVEWRGRRVKPGRAIYVCAEGEAGFRNRLQAYCQFHGLEDLPLGVIPDAPNLLEKGDVKDLLASVKAHGQVDIIVLDTFAQVMPGGNENSGEDVGRALAHCRALHRATGALVVLVHHAGKDASKGARGWSGLRAAADAEIEIERNENARTARITKLKDAEDGSEFGFRLNGVELGTDEDGELITSCVVAHGEVERKRAAPKGDIQKLVTRVAEEMLDLAETITTSELIDAVVDQMPFDKAEGKRDKRREHALRALESLSANGRLSTAGGNVSLQ
jgi:hypothetical protein